MRARQHPTVPSSAPRREQVAAPCAGRALSPGQLSMVAKSAAAREEAGNVGRVPGDRDPQGRRSREGVPSAWSSAPPP